MVYMALYINVSVPTNHYNIVKIYVYASELEHIVIFTY